MAGPPLRPGAVQLTSRLVSEFAVAETVGAPGVVGGSFTSVTVMVTPMLSVAVAVRDRDPLRS